MNTSLALIENTQPLYVTEIFTSSLNSIDFNSKTSLNLHNLDTEAVFKMNVNFIKSQNRTKVEEFIKGIFFKHHQATLKAFMPTLLSSRDAFGNIQCTVGIRNLNKQSVFLEQYLNEPIEKLISDIAEQEISRTSIAEVGNLACGSSVNSKNIIIMLVHHFFYQNKTWAVCTGTTMIQMILNKLGISYHYIDRANPERLAEDRDCWGTYYENNPCVLAVNVNSAMQVLSDTFYLEYGSK